MKNAVIFLLGLWFILHGVRSPGQPTLTFKMDNPRIFRGGSPVQTRFQFDVFLKASADGTYLYATQLAFNVANSSVFTLTAASISVDLSSINNNGGAYILSSKGWASGNIGFGVGITVDAISNDGSLAQDICIPIGIGITNPTGIAGTAGLTFNPSAIPAGPGQVQEYSLFDEILGKTNGYVSHKYSASNSFSGRDFTDIYLGRIYSSA